MSTSPSLSIPAGLPRELTDFLVELSVGLHKYAMYPDGHPLRESASTGITHRLAQLLAERGTLSIGIARDQLLIEGAGTDPAHAVMRDLALKLYRREIGAVRFREGIDDAELAEVLETIARDPAKSATAPRREWPHSSLLPLTYDQLALQSDANSGADGDEEHGGWANQLWSKLARSALTADGGAAATLADLLSDPLAFAREIERREGDPAVDHGLFGFLGQVVDEITSRGGAAAQALRTRASTLVRELTPQTLQRLLRMGGDAKQRRQLLLNASQALAADTVLDLAKAVAATSEHTMSEALLLLLAKLAKHAEKGSPARRDRADAALRENVRQLINDWDGAAALPEDSYWKTLEKLIAEPGQEQMAAARGQQEVSAEHVVQLSLEVEVFGSASKQAVAELIRRGRIGALLAMVDDTPAQNKVVWTLRRHLDNTGTIKRLLRDRPVDFEVLHRLVSRVGFPAAGALLDALEREDDRTARWRLFEMLAQLGPEVGTAVVARLPTAPWYVQRNLLLLLARLPQWPEGFTPVPYTRNSDARVRREAYALLLRDDATRSVAVVHALGDDDERIARAALSAALEHGCPREAVPVLVQRLAQRTLDGMLGALAIRALLPVRLRPVLDCLLSLALSPKRRWPFRRRLAPKSPVMLAAIAALAHAWSTDPAAAKVLALAEKESDPEIQAARRGTKIGSREVA